MKRFLSIIILLVMLTGCAHNDDSGDDNVSISELSKSKQECIDDIKSIKLDNITVSEDFWLGLADELGIYQIKCIDGFENKADKLFEKYIPANLMSKNKITDDKSSYPFGPSFKDQDNKLSVSVGCTGFFSYYNSESEFTQNLMYKNEIYKYSADKTLLSWNDERNRNLILGSTKTTLGEMIERIESFRNGFIKAADYPTNLKTGRVYIYTDEKGNNIVKTEQLPVFKDVPINPVAKRYNDEPNSLGRIPTAYTFADGSSDVSVFITQYAFEEYKTVKTIDSVISPVDALKKLSEKLAAHIDLNLLGAQLVYNSKYVGSCEPAHEGSSHRDTAPWSMCCSYDIFELEPCWLFWFDAAENKEVCATVNCVTADVTFIDNRDSSLSGV